MDTFINAIYLYDDKVLITFNYKEGTETVSFSEATEAAAKEKKFGYGLPWCTTSKRSGLFPIGEGFGFFVFFGELNQERFPVQNCTKRLDGQSEKQAGEQKNTYAATLLRRHKRGPLREILAVSGRGLAGKRVNKRYPLHGERAGWMADAQEGYWSQMEPSAFRRVITLWGAERELFFHIRHKIDADARFFRDGQITVLQLRDVVYHIALAQLDA